MDQYQTIYKNMLDISKRYGTTISDEFKTRDGFAAFVDGQLRRKKLESENPENILVSCSRGAKEFNSETAFLTLRKGVQQQQAAPSTRPTQTTPSFTSEALNEILDKVESEYTQRNLKDVCLAHGIPLESELHKDLFIFLTGFAQRSRKAILDLYAK